MAAAVYDPDPSFCRWFVEPAAYLFEGRRVRAAMVEYLRTGTDAERAGAVRASIMAFGRCLLVLHGRRLQVLDSMSPGGGAR